MAPTRNLAARVKLGASQSVSVGNWEVLGGGGATELVAGASDGKPVIDKLPDILQTKKLCLDFYHAEDEVTKNPLVSCQNHMIQIGDIVSLA